MGVFGMLAIGLMVFTLRQILVDEQWARVEPFIRVSFWGLNIGLILMVVTNLFPGGVLQLADVLRNGYWHARGPEFLATKSMRLIEWLRLPRRFCLHRVGRRSSLHWGGTDIHILETVKENGQSHCIVLSRI